jgi:hypothetical protein
MKMSLGTPSLGMLPVLPIEDNDPHQRSGVSTTISTVRE